MRNKMYRNLSILTIIAAMTGCVSIADMEKESFDKVYPRASFDMDCSKDKLDLIIINANQQGYPETIGVRGCDKKAVYVRPDRQTNWVLNSDATREK
jgi:hypothetical protein